MTHSGTKNSSRIHSMDILRGIMALAVATYHLSLHAELFAAGEWGNNAIAVCGLYSVQGFFIISGFCFFHLYGNTRFNAHELKIFHIKRFFRIAPLYYLAMTANLLLRQKTALFDVKQRLLENITFTFGLVSPDRGLVSGGWSIGVEYVFYLALPLLILITRRKKFLYIGTALLVLLAYPWTFHFVPDASHFDHYKFKTYVSIANHSFLFFVGGVLAHLRSLTSRRLQTGMVALGIAILAIVSEISANRFSDHFDCVTGIERVRWIIVLVVLMAMSACYDVPDSILRKPFVFFGQISYSVYLVHPFAEMIVLALFPISNPYSLLFAGLATTIALATLTYYGIEKLFMTLGRKFGDGFATGKANAATR